MQTHTLTKATNPETNKKSGTAPFFQAKLTVNTPGDAHEQEADQVADQVMRMQEDEEPMVQRKSLTPLSSIQRMCADCEEKQEGKVQRQETGSSSAGGQTAPPVVSQVLSSGGGRPMDRGTRQFMEQRFGQDFGQVRIHTGGQAAESASAIQAKAYTSGKDIVFGAGEYRPESGEGRRLLAHELVHVGQQGGERSSIQREDLPVETYSPCNGVWVSRNGNSVSITGRLVIRGAPANAAMAATIQSTINSLWTRTFSDGSSVSTNVLVTVSSSTRVLPGIDIEIKSDGTKPSYVSGCSMSLNVDRSDALTWVVAHEFGHILGMQDRYSESIISKMGRMIFGARGTTTAQPGYSGRMMGETGGSVDAQTVRDLTSENSAGLMDSDDRVRDWVNGHSMSQISSLSTRTKIQMIRTLLSIDSWGWVSSGDESAVGRICRSVNSSSEASQIRSQISNKLIQLTDIGQRTRIRVMFSRMP